MEDRRLAVTEDCVEAELMHDGRAYCRPEAETPRAEAPLGWFKGLLLRAKMLVAGALALLGIALFLTGAVLTSTVIGAIIGIPLMLSGAVVFFLLFKLLSLGSRNAFVFRRF